MKKRKLKAFVLPTLYVFIMAVLFVSITLLGNSLEAKTNNDDLSIEVIKEEESDTTPVVKAEEKIVIVKPFASDNVGISKSYYDMNSSEDVQQNSLVYYEKTYMQNSGVLYSSLETFDVISVLDGTVTNVSTDEILGNVVEITHNPNLKTVYYSLSEVNVKKDDAVEQGTIIGRSGDNKLEGEKENSLLFEVYYSGTTINPETFYTMDINDLQ